jgi:hypothetical protein
MRVKTMDNQISSGGGAGVDILLVALSWFMFMLGELFLFIGWGNLPILLSCLASACAIVKYGAEFYDKWNKKRRNKRIK